MMPMKTLEIQVIYSRQKGKLFDALVSRKKELQGAQRVNKNLFDALARHKRQKLQNFKEHTEFMFMADFYKETIYGRVFNG